MENDQYMKYETVLLGILQNCGKIEPFLEAVFSFLARRTDFFRWMHSKDDKLGFPPGYAEKMVIKIFERYQETVLRHEPSYKEWKRKNKGDVSKNTETSKQNNVPQPSREVEISTEETEKNSVDGDKINDVTTEKAGNKNKASKSDTNEEKIEDKKLGYTANKKDIKSSAEVDEHEAKPSITSSDAFNGGITDKYTWSQTLSDVDIKIPIPSYIKKSRDVIVSIKHDSIEVLLKNDPPLESGLTSKVLLAGKLSQRIKTEDSMWSLEPSKNITITLEKHKETWWTFVVEGEKEIDKQSIDTTQDMHDFDEQTQGDIRKVMFDQHQKMLGKPTSDEQKTYDMLEKAWDAEGSPFKGTPFDPSRVNVGGGGGGGGGGFPPPTS